MAYGCTVTVQAGKIPTTQSNFVWLITEANLPTTATDGGTNSVLNGGGNLRAYTDSTKSAAIPIEVVEFVTGGAPLVQVWGLSSTLSDTSTVYLEADASETTQPVTTAPLGRDAVWVGYEGVYHCQDANYTDSTGNGDLAVSGSNPPAIISTSEGNSYRFLKSNNTHIKRTITTPITSTPITIQAIYFNAKGGGTHTFAGGVSELGGGSDFSVGAYSGNSSSWVKATFPVNAEVTSKSIQRMGVAGELVRVNAVWDSTLGVAVSGEIGGEVAQPKALTTNAFNQGIVVIGLGGRLDGSPEYYDVDVARLTVYLGEKSQETITAETNNQKDSDTFWSASAWEDGGGGGGASSNVNIALTKPTFNVVGTVTIPAPSSSIIIDIAKPEFSIDASASLPSPIAVISTEINKPVFSVDSSVTLPNPNSLVDISISRPVFSLSGSQTTPSPQAALDLDISKPLFNLTGSASQPNPSALIELNISKPLFSVGGSVTLPYPLSQVEISVSKPLFNLTGEITKQTPVGNVDLEINKPIFNASGSVTLPSAVGAVQLTINKPALSIASTVSGLDIAVADNAKIKVISKSNKITLLHTSNKIRV